MQFFSSISLVTKFSRFFCNKEVQTVYKRPLPKFLISFTSEGGKKLFKEALGEGNMECYFPLSEQFMTQMDPSTCGSTTLAMVLNALSLDPKRRWKGIWRWYSEETIEGMKASYIKEGIDLENFSHITRHNNASIQTFYYPHDHEHSLDKYDCEHSCPKHRIRTASYQTFVTCLVASCRRTGLFMILNQSRKSLNQTGDGHFQPVGGVHLKEQKALLLDVARFKYPPYWCSLELLYKSLERLDSVTKRPRGFALISRDLESFSKICSISADETSRLKVKKVLQDNQFMKSFKELESNSKQTLDVFLSRFLIELEFDFRVLLIYNMYEVVDYLERQQEQANYIINTLQKSPVYSLAEIILAKFLEEKEEIGILIEEFCRDRSAFILSLVLLAIPKQELIKHCPEYLTSNLEAVFDSSFDKHKISTDLDQEIIDYLKKIVISFKNNLF